MIICTETSVLCACCRNKILCIATVGVTETRKSYCLAHPWQGGLTRRLHVRAATLMCTYFSKAK